MPSSLPCLGRKGLVAFIVAGALAVPGSSKAQNLPKGGFGAAAGGEIPDAPTTITHFKAICNEADGDETAALAAMRRLNFVELEAVRHTSYASLDYKLIVDIDAEASAIATCSTRAMTTSPANDFELLIAPLHQTGLNTATVNLSDVEYYDQTLGLRPTNDPSEMNSTDLKAITIIWSAPLLGRSI